MYICVSQRPMTYIERGVANPEEARSNDVTEVYKYRYIPYNNKSYKYPRILLSIHLLHTNMLAPMILPKDSHTHPNAQACTHTHTHTHKHTHTQTRYIPTRLSMNLNLWTYN